METEKDEHEFAKGEPNSAVTDLRVTYIEVAAAPNQPITIRARAPVIYKKSSGDRLELTPAEGRWLLNVLGRMLMPLRR